MKCHRYISLTLIILFTLCFCNSHALNQLPTFVQPQNVVVLFGDQNIHGVPMNITDWDAETLENCAAESQLPAGYNHILREAQQAHTAKVNNPGLFPQVPHVALLRIVIIGNNNAQYVYPISRIFVSGVTGQAAVATWVAANLHLQHGAIPPMPNLAQAAITPINNQLLQLCKGIENYRFTCYPQAAQGIAHSERTAILCILQNQEIINGNLQNNQYYIGNICNHFLTNHFGVGIHSIVVQMKVANENGPCNNCHSFCAGNRYVILTPIIAPARFHRFVGQNYRLSQTYDVPNLIRQESGINNIRLRISNSPVGQIPNIIFGF